MIRISALALCLVAFPAMAQPASDNFRRHFDPGDPAVQTTPSEYRSVFAPAPTQRPEITWPAANDEMAKLRGHAGHTRDSGPQGGPGRTSSPGGQAAGPHNQH